MPKEKGFSLIEILIVLGIIATLASVLVTRPSNPQKEYKRFFRRFSLMSKKIRNQSMTEGATYRMVFFMEPDKNLQAWAEKTNKPFLLGSEKENREKFREILKNVKNKGGKKKSKEEKRKDDGFRKASRFDFQKLRMPAGLKLKQIEISGIDYEITEGIATFHYFSHGLVEETALQFTGAGGEYKSTLVSDSISGEMYLIAGHKSLKELQER